MKGRLVHLHLQVASWAEPVVAERPEPHRRVPSWFCSPTRSFRFQGYTAKNGGWTVAAQVTLSVADVIAKVLFGSLIHKVTKLRTAEDIARSEDTHPESVYVSSERRAEAVLPRMREAGVHPHPGVTAAGLPRQEGLVGSSGMKPSERGSRQAPRSAGRRPRG